MEERAKIFYSTVAYLAGQEKINGLPYSAVVLLDAEEMDFWTREEFNTFIKYFEDKPKYYAMFMTLYYTGIREGEMLALTPADFDLEKATIRINKNYQNVNGEELITSPKTPKSNGVVTIPALLVNCLWEYMEKWYGLEQDDRVFPYTKNIVNHVMARACDAVGIKMIRVHDIRHSHASMLVELGFSPLLIAERLGHERVQTTMETYSHLYPNKQAEVAMQLDSLATND